MKNRNLLSKSAKICASLFAVTDVFIQNSKTYAVTLDFNLASTLKTCTAKADLEPVRCFVVAVTDFALDLMGALAFIMILYASIIYLISYGDEAKAEIAKKTLIWSVIGIIAVSAAKAILYIIKGAFN